MKQALFGAIRSKELDRLMAHVSKAEPVAMTGLPESMAAFMAVKLAEDTGKRVLLLSSNDLRATHDADDGQQLIGTQATFMPGGEIDLTRGASSHESAWRRLETLTRAANGELRLLCASVDAAVQRMGSADNFRKAIIRLKVGDVYDPKQLVGDLTRMGYERVNMVEGKAQCAMRGSSSCPRRGPPPPSPAGAAGRRTGRSPAAFPARRRGSPRACGLPQGPIPPHPAAPPWPG